MNKPLITIVIPTHDRKEKLVRLISSILKSNYRKDKLDIVVVDDASGEDYSDIRSKFPIMKLIKNKKNELAAETRNIGIRHSNGDYIFLIDDDNIVDKNCIQVLVDFMEKHENVGIAGPLAYYYDDPKRIWCAGTKRNYYTSVTSFVGGTEIDSEQYLKPIETEDIPNSFMVKREVFEKNVYFNSKQFPIHYEEADFCKRVELSGYEIRIVPQAKIWHDVPVPRDRSGRSFRLREGVAYYAAKNRILFHRKYNSLLQSLIFFPIFLPLITVYYLIEIARSNSDRKYRMIKAYVKGTMDGLMGV